MGIGEGILQSNNKQTPSSKGPLDNSSPEQRGSLNKKPSQSKEKDRQQLNIDKANSLLEEQKREERAGFRAQLEDDIPIATSDVQVPHGKMGGPSPAKDKASPKTDKYSDEFEEIEEDLPD